MTVFEGTEILQKYCPPVLLVLGGFGNVATIFVLRRINWGQSTQHVFLTALAVVDLLLLYTGLLDEWLWEAFGADVRGVHVAFCKIHEWLLYALGDASAWLLTAVTAQRTMSVVWPHRITSLCTMKRSARDASRLGGDTGNADGRKRMARSMTITVMFLSVTFLLLTLPLCVFLLWERYVGERIFEDEILLARYHILWSVTNMLWYTNSAVNFLLYCYQASLAIWKYCPPVLLVLGGFGNVATIFVLRRINWGQSTQHVFLTALAVVDLLLLYTGLLDEWIRYMGDSIYGDQIGTARPGLAWAVTNMLWYTNSAVNFLLYCVSGTKFRNEFVTWITCGVKTNVTDRRHRTSQTLSGNITVVST
nr:hypothetical protein BaRGS_021041 [Batillaria attramentaria]